LRFHPEKLRRVEHRAVEVDVDPEDKKLTNLHVDLGASEGDLAG
jgi:hypothetical protein